MSKNKNIKIFLIFLNLVLVLITSFQFYHLKDEQKILNQTYDNINSLNNVISNYFMGRIETVYLSSEYSDNQIKSKSIWLIPEVLKISDENIVKLDRFITLDEDKVTFVQVKSDFTNLKSKILEVYGFNKDRRKLNLDENRKMLALVYEDIPHLRNYFRESSDKLMKSFFKQVEVKSLLIESYENRLIVLLSLELIISLFLFILVFKKRFSIRP